MLQGLPPLMMVSNVSAYAGLYAAIPNKIVALRADQSAAANGASLTTTPWVNEGSGGSVSDPSNAHAWVTGSQNGMRGVTSTGTEGLSTAISGTSLWNSQARSFTFFGVQKNPSNSNSTIVSDTDGYHEIRFDIRRLQVHQTDGGSDYFANSSAVYTDNVAFAWAIRIDSSGNVRGNLNGTINTGTVSGLTQVGNVRLFGGLTGITVYELIGTSDELSNTDMDTFVLALKEKWGIA